MWMGESKLVIDSVKRSHGRREAEEAAEKERRRLGSGAGAVHMHQTPMDCCCALLLLLGASLSSCVIKPILILLLQASLAPLDSLTRCA